MLKAMIVDDEPAHRHGLARHVHWNSLGYDMPDEAEDAEEALFLSGRKSYDVYIVDVCMPGMDGIELVRQLHRMNRNINVLIVSGFEEFEFARGAVEAGAKAYLLKPLKIEEVEKWLKTFSENINRQKRALEADNIIKRKLENSLELAREKYLEELLDEYDFSKGISGEQMELLGLPARDFTYHIALISPDRYPDIIKKDPKKGSMLIPRISSMAKILLDDYFETIFVKILPGQLVVFLMPKECGKEVCTDEMEACFGMLQESMMNEDGLSLTVAVSRQGTGWDEAGKLYKEALYVLNRGRILKEGQILRAESFKQKDNKIFDFEQLQSKIVNSLNISDYENALYLLDIAMDQFENSENCSLTYVQAFAIGIAGAVIQSAELKEQTGRKYLNIYEELLRCSTISELRKLLSGMVSEFVTSELEQQSKQKNRTIEQAVAYLHEHYNEDITVNMLADHVYMNSSYLSVLFKKEMGETITDYLTRIRIEKAKELIRDNKIKIYEIAGHVGYQTASYFTHQFKKLVGCTPAEFRERRL